jgi:hypothetical protein
MFKGASRNAARSRSTFLAPLPSNQSCWGRIRSPDSKVARDRRRAHHGGDSLGTGGGVLGLRRPLRHLFRLPFARGRGAPKKRLRPSFPESTSVPELASATRVMDAGGPLPGDRTGGSLPVVVASDIGSLDFEGHESKRSLRLRLCPRHSLVLWLAPTVSTCE